MIYLYFDKTGTLKEVINDESIRRGSTNVNGLAVYCELWDDEDFELDDIWYCQRVSCGRLTPEVSFVDNLEIMQVPYKKDVDYTYFKDFKQYKFYVFEFTTEYTQYSGLNVGTVRFAVDDGINALGTITFNIQDNVIKEDNNITQSQYDYLLLSYASRTLNEETGRTLCELIEDIVREQAKITGIEYVGTTEEILALTEDLGIALSTTNAHIYNWDADLGSYVDSGIEFMDISLSSNVMTLSGSQTVSGNKTFTGAQTFSGTTIFSGASVHSNNVEANNIIGNSGSIKALNLKSGNSENSVVIDNTKVKIEHTGTHPYETTTASVEVKSANVEIVATNIELRAEEIVLDAEVYATVINGVGTNELLLRTNYGVYIVSNDYSLIVDDLGITIKKGNAIVMSLRYDTLNDEHIIESDAILKDVKCNTPSQSQDLANKGYVDAIKTTLENLLSGKADLNNAEQEITAFEITTENMNVADLYQNGANITLDSAFGGISFKPSGSNKYITIGAGQIKGIDTVSNNTDATNKQYVDGIKTNLQSQIDGINAGQNLADIVADLTALNNLSTTNLQVGDKVQVLVDSNHDNGSTVYNWNGSAWVYIGKYGQDGYTKSEEDTLLATKQDVIDSSHKLSSDLVDDTNATNKFVSASEKTQITTNQNAIAGITNGTTINTFGAVETALSGKVDMLQPDWADQVYVKKSDGTNSSYYIDFNSTPYSVCIRNSSGRVNVVGAIYDSQVINLGQWKNDLQVKRHFINATISDGVNTLTAIISILSPIATLNTATLIKNYFKEKGYKIPSTSTYLLTDVSIFLTATSNNLVGVVYDETNDKFIANGTSYSLVSITSETITKDILPQ